MISCPVWAWVFALQRGQPVNGGREPRFYVNLLGPPKGVQGPCTWGGLFWNCPG